jgi:hypothetical protein
MPNNSRATRRAGRIEDGKSGGGNSYGYDVVRTFDAVGEPVRGERRINPAEAEIIKEIFTRYAGGASPRKIAMDLNARGVSAPGAAAPGAGARSMATAPAGPAS